MKTIFCPNHDSTNESINKEVAFLNEQGIETYDFADFKKKPWQLASISIANLNWYDDINEGSKVKAFLILVKKILTITVLKFLGTKIIYTLHNKIAHDGKSPKENIILKKYIMKRADTIALISNRSSTYVEKLIGDNSKKKYYYVGHPSYSSSVDDVCMDHGEKFVLLYYGMVRPYKNIEMLIDIWRELNLNNAVLVIAGKPIDENYKRVIENAAKGVTNIELHLQYVENKELDRMISEADVIVSPLNKKSSLNSGTLVKAFCMKKTIVIPDIEMVYDYDLESMFVYSYETEKEHIDNLKKKIKEAYDTYLSNPNKIYAMGEKLYIDFMKLNNDVAFKERYIKMYIKA